jgi:hypothetical protein
MSGFLIVYAASQTYTSTVYEHLYAFQRYSDAECQYINVDEFEKNDVDLVSFFAIIVHYSVRLPFGQLRNASIARLKAYEGLKVLFIQDDYNNTGLSKKTIRNVGFSLVYTAVPSSSIEKIYPREEFEGTKFINCLTGYVSEGLAEQGASCTGPSKRKVDVAFRGRSLPVWYGKLGQQKIEVARRVQEYCEVRRISCDIQCNEHSRIYGDDWYKFISSARSMLGSESGSNVFDWNGSLRKEVQQYWRQNPSSSKQDVYSAVIQKHEIDGLMNQISPRIFEMASLKTAMVLLEGEYSGVLTPWVHFIPIKKDFSNLKEVFETVLNDEKVDEMADRAYKDIIASGRYSYKSFIKWFDSELLCSSYYRRAETHNDRPLGQLAASGVTSVPLRAKPPLPKILSGRLGFLGKVVIAIWDWLPMGLRPIVKALFGRG